MSEKKEPFTDTPEGYVCNICKASLGSGSEIELHAPTCDYVKSIETAKSVQAVVVEVECPHCHGKKRLPGGTYVAQGEVINCQACSGKGTVRSSIPLGMLYDLLMGNIKR
jgi:DnaJ-class molecular chaperone